MLLTKTNWCKGRVCWRSMLAQQVADSVCPCAATFAGPREGLPAFGHSEGSLDRELKQRNEFSK
jgi:hypothetical protein